MFLVALAIQGLCLACLHSLPPSLPPHLRISICHTCLTILTNSLTSLTSITLLIS